MDFYYSLKFTYWLISGYLALNSKNIFFHSSSVFRHKWMLLPSSKNFVAGIVAITTNINLFDNLNKLSMNCRTSLSGICSITSVQIKPSNFLTG